MAAGGNTRQKLLFPERQFRATTPNVKNRTLAREAKRGPTGLNVFTKTYQVHKMVEDYSVRMSLVHRHDDGSAGDANYGKIGQGYTAYRQPDPAIASFLEQDPW